MTDELYKLSGGGNDFLARVVDGAGAADELERHLPRPDQVRDWTSRGLSLGADGFFLLEPTAPGRARMIYLNADGTRARLCLNGTRCAARLAFELGWHSPDDDRLVIDNDAGAFPARRVGPTEVSVLLPRLETPPERRAPEAGGRPWPGWFLRVGVPHFVLHWQGDLAEAPVDQLGRQLRHHEAFAPDGTNVDFVRYPEPGRVEVRSYERGVEAETLACGTGVVAALAVGLREGLARLPSRVTTRGGFVLHAHSEDTEDSEADGAFSLAGDARIVARVAPTSEASGLPARPWG
jgi:diaminopimelate epimerase